nr:MAG TPA: hypothetical protein [Caudoviricetes sp.]
MSSLAHFSFNCLPFFKSVCCHFNFPLSSF